MQREAISFDSRDGPRHSRLLLPREQPDPVVPDGTPDAGQGLNETWDQAVEEMPNPLYIPRVEIDHALASLHSRRLGGAGLVLFREVRRTVGKGVNRLDHKPARRLRKRRVQPVDGVPSFHDDALLREDRAGVGLVARQMNCDSRVLIIGVVGPEERSRTPVTGQKGRVYIDRIKPAGVEQRVTQQEREGRDADQVWGVPAESLGDLLVTS